MTFDRSAKIYTSLLFLVTTNFTLVALTKTLGRLAGGIFIGAFAIYLVSIGYAIYKGVLNAPEDSENDDSDDDGSSEGNGAEAQHNYTPAEVSLFLLNNAGGGRSSHSWKHTLL